MPSYCHCIFLLFKLFSPEWFCNWNTLNSMISSLKQQQTNARGYEKKKEGWGGHLFLQNVTFVLVKSWMMEETTWWPVCVMSFGTTAMLGGILLSFSGRHIPGKLCTFCGNYSLWCTLRNQLWQPPVPVCNRSVGMLSCVAITSILKEKG